MQPKDFEKPPKSNAEKFKNISIQLTKQTLNLLWKSAKFVARMTMLGARKAKTAYDHRKQTKATIMLPPAALEQAATVLAAEPLPKSPPKPQPLLQNEPQNASKPEPAQKNTPKPETPKTNPQTTQKIRSEAHFSPSEDCLETILEMFQIARKSVDVCVFTITDNRISNAMIAAHRRGVQIRIITDDEKSEDLGSDIEHLQEAGIPLILDEHPGHMHHKFAIFDNNALLTGSYNWTRSASLDNFENILVTDDPKLVAAFSQEFSRLWKQFSARKTN